MRWRLRLRDRGGCRARAAGPTSGLGLEGVTRAPRGASLTIVDRPVLELPSACAGVGPVGTAAAARPACADWHPGRHRCCHPRACRLASSAAAARVARSLPAAGSCCLVLAELLRSRAAAALSTGAQPTLHACPCQYVHVSGLRTPQGMATGPATRLSGQARASYCLALQLRRLIFVRASPPSMSASSQLPSMFLSPMCHRRCSPSSSSR